MFAPQSCFKTDPDEKGTESLSTLGSMPSLISVSRLIPMKRELKVESSDPSKQHRLSVSRLIPMKRELKEYLLAPNICQLLGFKTDPDEKGTERVRNIYCPNSYEIVSRLIPMKRELKVTSPTS